MAPRLKKVRGLVLDALGLIPMGRPKGGVRK